jgi:probable F420-dependent oxidoreductase
MDPFVTLSAAAASTTRLMLGTAICLVVQRDPIQTAKSVASIDQISNGRFLFGVGAGWNAEEMVNHGTVYKTRLSLMRERIEAMRQIWTQSTASFSGRFVEFADMMSWPKPVQKPHPPIIMGGAFPFGAQRAVDYCDGWFPHAVRPAYGDVIEMFPQFRQMASEAGRDPESIPITVYGVAENIDLLKRYRDAGTARVMFELPSAGQEEILPMLDRCAELARQVS